MEKQKVSKETRLFREAIRKRSEEENSLILYIVEVHEDEKNHQYYVNIRHIIENRTNVCFPIGLCKEVVDKLLDSKEATGEIPNFNLELVKPCKIENTDKTFFVEIMKKEDAPGKLFIQGGPSNDAANSDQVFPWNSRGTVELKSIITGRMIKVLIDIMVRYKNISNLPEAPSLYSSSGGRRFFFDIRETKWGKRMQISQLTQKRRNTIGVPLENLIQFRDRLDHFIKELSLNDAPVLNLPRPVTSTKVLPKKTSRRGPPKPRKLRGSKTTQQDGAAPKTNTAPAADKTSAPTVAQTPVPEVSA